LRGHVFQQPMPTQSRGHGTQEVLVQCCAETSVAALSERWTSTNGYDQRAACIATPNGPS
jgi:hypothetical protein